MVAVIHQRFFFTILCWFGEPFLSVVRHAGKAEHGEQRVLTQVETEKKLLEKMWLGKG